MSAWTRIAVLAAGAAVGAAAGRAAGSDEGRRALGQAVERGRGAVEPTQTPLQSADPAQHLRENRVGSRILRLAQDIRVGMDQAETELRDQLGSPAQGRAPQHRGQSSGELRGAASGAQAPEQTIIDHDGDAQTAVDGSDRRGT